MSLKRNKKNIIMIFSILLIVFLCIGYAVLTSNLSVNGLFSFSKNEWNIYLDNIVLDNNCSSKELPIISEDKNSVSFNASLSKPYDFYKFYIDVVNESTIDAMVDSIELTGISEENKKYVDSSITYFDGSPISVNNKLLKDARSVIKIELKYKDINIDEIPAVDINLNVVFSINYRQDDGTSSLVPGSNSWAFDYKGSEDTFSILISGNYKLEVWGASGLSHSRWGGTPGNGGYSVGNISLNKDSNLYINIGGNEGKILSNGVVSGYNGAGGSRSFYSSDSSYKYTAAGGGATHIATKSGLLASLENNIDSIILVAGGGGGAERSTGGSGGGFKGATIIDESHSMVAGLHGTGGTQTTAGIGGQHIEHLPTRDLNGSFGQGGNAYSSTDDGAGGGGGFYGGGATTYIGSGGGGSGYIGNSLLTDKAMYCYKCEESSEEPTKTISTFDVSSNPISEYAKIGNGFARITYMG